MPSDCLSSTVGNRSLAPCGQCAAPTAYGPPPLSAAQWDATVCPADCNGGTGGGYRLDVCGR